MYTLLIVTLLVLPDQVLLIDEQRFAQLDRRSCMATAEDAAAQLQPDARVRVAAACVLLV